MSIELFPKGNLTPRQLLAMALNDPGVDQIESIAIVYLTKDGIYATSWSHTPWSQIATMGSLLHTEAIEKIRTS